MQQSILDFIRSFTAQNGAPPTYREIQSHFGYKSIGAVQDHIRALRNKGHLPPPSQKARAFQIKPFSRFGIPIRGEIHASPPTLSEEVPLGVLELPHKSTCYSLRVRGGSMEGAGIYEGDIVVIDSDAIIRRNDIVVALIDGEVTLKRYIIQAGREMLQAEYAPEPNKITIPLTNSVSVTIQGKVIGVWRALP